MGKKVMAVSPTTLRRVQKDLQRRNVLNVPTLSNPESPLSRACVEMSKRNALLGDWNDWFPGTIKLRLGLSCDCVTAEHVQQYAILRVEEDDDEARFLEAAQCLALLHYLGNPSPGTVIACQT